MNFHRIAGSQKAKLRKAELPSAVNMGSLRAYEPAMVTNEKIKGNGLFTRAACHC